jgi:hypothetical protein
MPSKIDFFKKILIAIALFSFLDLGAQVQMGNYEYYHRETKPFNKKWLDGLKKTKTIFVYHPFEAEMVEKVKERISKFWTVTELEFIPYEDAKRQLKSRKKGRYSFIQFDAYAIIKSDPNSSLGDHMTKLYSYRDFYYYAGDKKRSMGQIHFDPTLESFSDMNQKGLLRYNSDFGMTKVLKELVSGNVTYFNHSAGHLLIYMKDLHNRLVKNNPTHLSEEIIRPEELEKLNTSTLYLDEILLEKRNVFNRAKLEIVPPEEILGKYAHPTKIVDIKSISDLILNPPEEDAYFLVCQGVNARTSFQVYNLKTQKIVFTSFDKGLFKIKSVKNGFKSLNKEIKKASK